MTAADKKGADSARCRPATETSFLGQRGVFPFSWEWQLVGLISAMVTGLLLCIVSQGSYLPLLFVGMALLGVSSYAAVKTNWLRSVMQAPLPAKIGGGVAIVCGLVPIGAALLGLAIAAGVFAILFAALGNK